MQPRRLARWGLPLVLTFGCLSSPSGVAPPPGPTIVVGGRPVAAHGITTVQQALARARVVVPAGRVLAAVSHRPLAGDHQPGEVLLDGTPATPDSVVRPGAVLTVVPGEDVTEPLTVRSEPVPPDEGLASLYVGGRDGRSRVVQGALSGETVSRQLVVPPLPGHLVTAGAVALTFDDGPDPTWTPRVLAALRLAHVHATFCLVGWEVRKYPALVRAIVAGGHTLCNHTWSHDEHVSSRSTGRMTYELVRTQQAVKAACGLTPRLFRAPGGSWSARLEAVALAHGMRPLKWTVDPRDWARPGVARILGVVLATLRPGGIVLLHDGGGERSQTLAALRWLLVRLPVMRYSFQVPRP